MKQRKINGKFWATIGLSVAMLCGAMSVGGGYLLSKQDADITADAVATSTVINNLFDSTKKTFNLDNLDLLAQTAGYTDYFDMVDTVEASATATTTGLKDASQFSGATVKFGSYTYNGNTYELSWLPAYLSKSKPKSETEDGHAILTLWLADVDPQNAASKQEYATASDGTMSYPTSGNVFSVQKDYTENGETVRVISNTYDSSYLRHAILNADSGFVGPWPYYCPTPTGGHKSYTGTTSPVTMPSTSLLTKYTAFTSPTGDLYNFIATPSQMAWQMAESTYANDPAFKGSNYTYYHSNWTGDKVWLPSRSEIGDSAIWNMKAAQRKTTTATVDIPNWYKSGSVGMWTRSNGTSNTCPHVWDPYDFSGETVQPASSIGHVQNAHAVRPAIHLDLTAVEDALQVKVKYLNVTKDGSGVESTASLVADADSEGWHTISKSSSSTDEIVNPDSTPTNHKFIAWTTDKDNPLDTTKYVTSKTQIRGEVELYAVWGLADGITVNAAFAAKDGKTTAAYDDTVKILLQPSVTVNGNQLPNTVMTSGVNIKYTWKKTDDKGNTVTVGSAGEEYSPQNVADSGTYTYDFIMSSTTEPLWLFNGSSSGTTGSVLATITPAEVMLSSFTVKRASNNSPTFYYGMGLQELTPAGTTFISKKSYATIPGTVAFDGNYALSIGDLEDDNDGGKGIKVDLIFTPNDKNYETKTVPVFIYPEELPLNFELSYNGNGTTDYTLTTGLEYGNNNSASKIANDFEAAFAKFLDEFQNNTTVSRTIAGKRPFIVGGVEGASEANPISLDAYRKSGASIDGPTTAVTIKISLLLEKYDVTLDADNGVDDVVVKNQEYGYGMRISQNDWPGGKKPVKDGSEFLGWFVVDDSGNLTTEEWDPDTSRVMQDVTIRAKWFVQTLTFDRIEVTGNDKEGVFVADTPLQDGDLTVVAIYKGLNSKGENVEVPKTLSLGEYTLKYQSGNAPYVSAPDVTVSFTDGKTAKETVTLNVAPKRYEVTQTSFRSVSYSVDDENKRIPEISTGDLSKNGMFIKSVTYTYSAGGVELPDKDSVNLTMPAIYWVTAHFELQTGYDVNYYVEDIQVRLEIYEGKTPLTVKWDTDTLTYNGVGQHPKLKLMNDGVEFIPSAEDNITLEYIIMGNNVSTNAETGEKEAVIVGTYQVAVRILSDDDVVVKYVLKDGTETDEQLLFSFKIIKAKLAKPTAENELEYNGNMQSVTDLLGSTYNENLMKLTQTYEATDAGTYRAGIALVDTRNSEWEDGTNSSVTITWQIKKLMLYADWGADSYKIVLGEGGSIPSVINLDGLVSEDQGIDLNSGVLLYRGTTTLPTEVGSYQITVQLNNAALSKNYTIDPATAAWDFVVVPNDRVTVIDIEWDTATFTFDGATHSPVATVRDMDGNEMAIPFSYSGDTSAKWEKEGGYTISVNVSDEYFIRKGATFKYNVVANADGKGGLADSDNPFNPTGDGKDDGTDGGDKKPSENTVTGLPLWQLIVGGASAVLFVFCSLKAFGEYGKLKAAKKEAKELASQSYYGFAPLPLLAMGAGETFLGLEETPWTIIALLALGLFLVSAVALFLLSKKRKAAELVVKREQARIAEEKDFAREEEMLRREEQHREEQARRDNEMKMMFAAMQQGGGGYGQAAFQYDDMRSLLAETMQALLPAAMQQMQALPPAQSDPNAYAQPNYGAPADSARSQKEDMLLERLARQEELINQLLQNQQAQQAAPAYEEEEIVDDISWLGENDEIVSLEESYGALSDEAKRAYYEIGSYIMSKPRTSQNDGRYAVLFKYRRKTLFKLGIKGDAPVLYYPEGSGRGEVRITDPASLDYAKSIIDMQVQKIDSQMA